MKDVNRFIDMCALTVFAVLQALAFAGMAWAVAFLWR